MRTLLIFSLTLLFSGQLPGQLSGLVLDEAGSPSPYTSIYVQGTSTGTLSNEDGFYELSLDAGIWQVVFDRIGYKKQIFDVEIKGEPVELHVTMREEAIELIEIEVSSEGEDPAYPIIRKAIEKREYYNKLIDSYSCDVYVKGRLKLLETPKQILGQEVGDMDGLLDSTGQGIIYLSESESVLHFMQPDNYKEVMTSSRVSGNDNGFSFNSATDMDFSLYRSYSTFPRQIISPIANNAFSYYRYRLESSVYDEEGRLINKIALLPKREEDPVYRGYIYIVEDLWNLEYVDVYVTGKAMNEPLFDTMNIRQQYVPVEAPDKWALFSQTFQFKGGLMGFVFGGEFAGVYSDYNLNPNLDKKFFDNEVFRVEEGANELKEDYFEEVRPIPLTNEEVVDYHRKDSLQVVRTSKPYLDSLDKEANKFQAIHLLAGYTWRNSWEHTRWQISSPIDGIQFNTVQGLNGRLGMSYRKSTDLNRSSEYEIKSTLYYGYSDKQWLNDWQFRYRFDQVRFRELKLAGGTKVAQFFDGKPISTTNNEFYSLYFKRNYLKIFRKGYVSANYRQEFFNGLMGWLDVEWAQRNPLTNHSDYSFINWEERSYVSNDPQNPNNFDPAFQTSNSLSFGISLRFRPEQKFLSYPKRKFIVGSDWPDFLLTYRKGIPVEGASDTDYDRLSLEVIQENINIGLVGRFTWMVQGGLFLNSNELEFMDWKHFNGNQTVFAKTTAYIRQFQLLQYYQNSTTDPWFQAHFQHHFNGFIMDKLPLLRKTGFHFVAGASFLQTFPELEEDAGPYGEFSLGIDDLGWGAFRLLRLDGVISLDENGYKDWGIILGIKLPPLDVE
ncbi:MAG: carboxypeptidase-like regulatory domain-containing protein [Bacteroidetes bacterium]|nr:carboxypeptidase-like regulatory domain-containing protein [Bacteroidota bacterium]